MHPVAKSHNEIKQNTGRPSLINFTVSHYLLQRVSTYMEIISY